MMATFRHRCVVAALLAGLVASCSATDQAEPGPDQADQPETAREAAMLTDVSEVAHDSDTDTDAEVAGLVDSSLTPDTWPPTPDLSDTDPDPDAEVGILVDSSLTPDSWPPTPDLSDPFDLPPDPCLVLVCDDQNPCTADWCTPESGCMHGPADLPCNDGDPCTNSDWCVQGVCTGQPSPCDEGLVCDKGKCICEVTCDGKQCGFDSCGSVCGVCGFWQDCTDDLCVDHHPAPPYGPNQGQTMPDHEFKLPADLSSVSMRQFWTQGKLLLMTYNAGWCIVCKQDTVLLNLWHAAYQPAGLQIVSVMYENPSGTPITQEYAKYWQSYFATQYPLLMDQSYADAQGKAAGGALNYYYTPVGPIPDGTFPVTLLVCPKDMRILYIKAGFYDEEVTPLVMKYLFEEDC